MIFRGAFVESDFRNVLRYDVYYKDFNVRIDEYLDGKKITKSIYNAKEDRTTINYPKEINITEVINDNMLPIRLLDLEFLEEMEVNDEKGFFLLSM